MGSRLERIYIVDTLCVICLLLQLYEICTKSVRALHSSKLELLIELFYTHTLCV